ncbi:DUF6531 domain-containing protein [Paraburkholderia madseniana]|uniref:RHS repeat-associated core domain-containing protein n=1 Tax=Paraburkholderia madseniana TaxID=2599607 RepID=UPI0015C55C7D|nr:RHS repeat-associated core domain-containing protein [Paraburkholderia madseniana]NPT68954.1 type IV secretion protein Rhs [Paraburkholderia madseniana]
MTLLAVKHLDPVVGVDVHSVLVTPGTPPVFLPHPHVGFMLDLREYVEAAKGVVGSIAMTIVQEKVTEYIADHPDEVKKLKDQADAAMRTMNDVAGIMSGKLPDIKDNPNVAEGVHLAKEGKALANRIGDALGSNVGAGGSSGRSIFVNGLLRATAGTHAYHVPGLHFPLGESFLPPPAENPEPSNDGESFMGSKTVLANNDPMSFMALPALSCWSIGMEPPSHNGAHTERTYPSMPSSVMLPIPVGRPVLVGGPPVMNMAATATGLFKAFQGSDWAKALADKLHLKPGFLRCNVLRAEPVDVTTGEVVVQQHDFTVAGRLPLVWDRYYASHDIHAGAIGVGWRTPADIRLELMRNGGGIGAAAFFPDHATAYNVVPPADGWSARTYDWQHGQALYCDNGRMVLRTREGVEYEFVLPSRWRDAVAAIDGDSRLTWPIDRMADLNGNAWVFERDAYGGLVRLVEWKHDGQTERLIECGTGRGLHVGLLTSLILIDADGNAHPLVSYEHNRERDLTAALDAMGHPHHFEYAAGHRMVSHTSARGVSFYYRYQQGDDGVWRVDHTWGDNGLLDYRFVYDRMRMETRVTNSLGHTTIMQMNERGMPVAEIDPLGGVTSYQYDPQGRANAQTDPAGQTVRWDYDWYGNFVAQTLPDGSTIRTEYDANHRPVCVTLPGGRQWRYEWDAQCNLLVQAAPSGAASRYKYDSYGQPTAHIGPHGALTQFGYDRDGYLAAMTDPLGHCAQYRHDARGNLVVAIDALGQLSRYEYDRNGNLTRAIEPGEREVHCIYDADGNFVHYRDPAGNVTQMAYSALGQLSKRLTPDGNTVEYRYDTEEQLVGVVNERGELYQLKRDGLGRIVEEVDYWGQVRRYRYGMSGKLLGSTNPLGQIIEYRYDRRGRIVEKRVPGAAHDDGVRINRFTYDRHGSMVLAQTPSSRVEFRYDADGRMIEERQGDDFTITSTYDAVGNRTKRTTRLLASSAIVEHTVCYAYDARGSVTSIQIDNAAPVVLERNALGQVVVERLGANLRRELSYEAGGQLARQALLADAGELFAVEFAYDANDEVVARRDSRMGTEWFQYDPVGRVIAHTDPARRLHRHLYDQAGDLLKTHVRARSETDAASDATQVDNWMREGEYDGCNYVYDRVGNLIHAQGADQDLILRWDAAGQLVETVSLRPVLAGATGQPVRIRAVYEYDAFQRRVRKIVHVQQDRHGSAAIYENPSAPSHICRYFWDADTLIAECALDADKTLPNAGDENTSARQTQLYGACVAAEQSFRREREWVFYPETFQVLAVAYCCYLQRDDLNCPSAGAKRITGSGPLEATVAAPERMPAASTLSGKGVYFFENDLNGAPVRMHDDCGRVVWEARYGPLGRVESIATNLIEQPIRLQGQIFDRESGLNCNRHRYFDPSVGIFISRDPIGLVGGVNLYQLAPNSFRWADPTGLKKKDGGRDYMNAGRATIVVGNGVPQVYISDNKKKEMHAEQDALFDNLLKIDNQDVTLKDIEGDYRSNARGNWTDPATICTVRCRSEMFWGAHIGNAASLTFPMTVGKKLLRNVTIKRGHFQYLAEEMGRLEKANPHNTSRAKKQWDAITLCEQEQCSHD